jgi:hypothetical protein
MRIANSGNVGIGETDPDGELHVKGIDGGNGDMYVERTSGAKIHLQAQSANGKIGTSSNHNLGLNTNGTTRVTVDTNGNVRIGTGTPDYKLEVEGASGTTVAIKTPWAANAYGQYKFATPTGEASMRSRVPGNSTVGLEFYTYGSNNGTAKMSILGGGNVEMPYQAGARYGIPTTQTIGTSFSVVNFSDANASYGGYQRTGISSSNGTITVTNAGIYDISMCARTEATPFRSASQFKMMFDNSGTGSGTFVEWQRLYINANSQASYEHAPPFHAKVQLVAGARFQITAVVGSGSYQLSTTSNTVNFLTINKIA